MKGVGTGCLERVQSIHTYRTDTNNATKLGSCSSASLPLTKQFCVLLILHVCNYHSQIFNVFQCSRISSPPTFCYTEIALCVLWASGCTCIYTRTRTVYFCSSVIIEKSSKNKTMICSTHIDILSSSMPSMQPNILSSWMTLVLCSKPVNAVLVTIPHYSMCSLLWYIWHIHCDMTPIQSGGKCDLFVFSHPRVSYDFPYNGLILTTRKGLISVFMYAPCTHLSHLILPYHSWILQTLCKTEVSFSMCLPVAHRWIAP